MSTTSVFDSCSFTHQFRLSFLGTEKFAISRGVGSGDIFAGGRLWRFMCYPRGFRTKDNGKYLSVSACLQHLSKSESIKAIFEASVMDKDGTLSSSHKGRLETVFVPSKGWVLSRFVKRSVLESLYVTNDFFIIMCGVKVVLDDAPLPDIGNHLGDLLDCTDGSDVSFVIDGEMFPAHRAVLAARSPVFKALLLGSMAEANMPSITLHDIEPLTFKVMLRFMYTDACPADSELGDSPDEMFRCLLAAADRFALDRLKILCAVKLWDAISVDTVSATLFCAEIYNCPQLKKKCIDFTTEENNFNRLPCPATVNMSASMFDSCSFTHQFRLSFQRTERFPISEAVGSEDIFAGGHLWRIVCYPRGARTKDNGEYLSIGLQHLSKSESVKAIFEANMMNKNGPLSTTLKKRFAHVFVPNSSRCCFHFIKRSEIESCLLESLSRFILDSFVIMCGVKVVHEDPIEVPPSDMGRHLGLLLDCTDGSDVTFVVNSEKFPAHRAVLAARSPVFKAQLLGSMADAKMPTITLHDIAPATFKVMLWFIYTDAFPKNDELGDSRDDMVRHLLAAADRFALDRLKILCAADLGDNMSVDTVAATLICAEAYNCLQLKKKCIDFIVEKNFKKVALTDGYVQLGQQFPSILGELAKKVGAY